MAVLEGRDFSRNPIGVQKLFLFRDKFCKKKKKKKKKKTGKMVKQNPS